MHLKDMTWREVETFDRSCVVLIPIGSLEQHGPGLPLFTDSYIVTAVAQEVESRMPQRVLLTPTLWLGASDHHLEMPGTLSARFEVQIGAVESVVESLLPHGFRKFYLLNSHGGNVAGNSIAMRKLKRRNPNAVFGAMGYYDGIADLVASLMEGPQKDLRHACEAETSLMLALRPDLVRSDRIRDGGLKPDPPVRFAVHSFEEITEEGVLGNPSLATAEKGQAIFEGAVLSVSAELAAVATGYVLRGD